MTKSSRDSIYEAIASIRLIDPHTHINPHSPASTTLADLLGYHYYTELAHSAGMPKRQIEQAGIGPRELVGRLVSNLRPIENTANYRWLIEICRMFFGFDGDRIDQSNWESLYDSAESVMASADWPQMVLDQSNVEAVFLTNDFDDALEGFDSDTYIPCLRTDDLVFHLAKTSVRDRLAACSEIELDGSLGSLRASLRQRFEHFVGRGARACAISLPPTFSPAAVSDGRATTALNHVLKHGELADPAHKDALSRRVFWTLAELCDEFGLPFDLMIGVNRGVYASGVYQGQDLYDSRVSLTQYSELFNAFPGVKFPISVLASVTNQELVSHAWIFPNVITNGHWWYSNTPSFISRDAMARLEAVPQNKQIGYYSDAYKLEFVWPKFDMYRNVLADLLDQHFVGRCGWTEERAVELGRRILRDNVDEIFPRPSMPESRSSASSADVNETILETDGLLDDLALASSTAALAAGAIGMVEIDRDQNEVEEDLGATESDDPSINDTLPMETVLEESDSALLGPDQSERPTLIDEADETVRIEGGEEPDIDPVPNDDEIESLEVDDVQISELATERAVISDDLVAEAGDEPLDVGDLLDETPLEDTIEFEPTETDQESDGPKIRQLRNEGSFSPDEESLRLAPDPMTGELTYPVPDEVAEDDALHIAGDDELVIDFEDSDIGDLDLEADVDDKDPQA